MPSPASSSGTADRDLAARVAADKTRPLPRRRTQLLFGQLGRS